MKKLIITGPEATGKTTLARQLAGELATLWVPEYARTYLEGRQGYVEADLLEIARGQQKREQAYALEACGVLVCDTSLEVIYVWSEYRYGRVHPWIVNQLSADPGDLYLLCYPDLPWEPDPLRENPHDRDALFGRYMQLLEHFGLAYSVIKGFGEVRALEAVRTIAQHG